MALALSGELTFATVLEKRDALRDELSQPGAAAALDLSGVTRVDSAGLSLLLELTRLARAQHRELRFTGAPEPLQRLAGFFGLSEVLPLAN